MKIELIDDLLMTVQATTKSTKHVIVWEESIFKNGSIWYVQEGTIKYAIWFDISFPDLSQAKASLSANGNYFLEVPLIKDPLLKWASAYLPDEFYQRPEWITQYWKKRLRLNSKL
jgi:hypothetical protein